MKIRSVVILFIACALAASVAWADATPEECAASTDKFRNLSANVAEMISTSYGYAVLPTIGKGGFGIGGAGGSGCVYAGGTQTGTVKMGQVTIGFQAGGQKYAEVIFFENAEAYERFTSNKFEFAAQVSAIALKSGVSLDAEYAEGMLVFTMAIGGLMYEASIGGQKFKTEMY